MLRRMAHTNDKGMRIAIHPLKNLQRTMRACDEWLQPMYWYILNCALESPPVGAYEIEQSPFTFRYFEDVAILLYEIMLTVPFP